MTESINKVSKSQTDWSLSDKSFILSSLPFSIGTFELHKSCLSYIKVNGVIEQFD